MSELAEALIGLLDGDFVRLETADLCVRAEVTDHRRESYDGPGDALWEYRIGFMPVGDDATRVDADRYCVTVEPDGRCGWNVGEVVAEVYHEEDLSYRSESRGPLDDVVLLSGP